MAIDIGRRQFVSALGGAAVAWPLAARAQPDDGMRRIGLLVSFVETDSEAQSSVQTLVQRLDELGWSQGRNLRIDYRWGAADPTRSLDLANELIALQPNLVVACAARAAIAFRQATRIVPGVFVQVLDPIELGLVASLAIPGGNLTGFSNFELTIGSKWLGTLLEIAPRTKRVATVFDPDNPTWMPYLRSIITAASSFDVQLSEVRVRNADDIRAAISDLSRTPAGALIVVPNSVTQLHREVLAKVATASGLPAVYPYRFYAESGGLISYGVDNRVLYRQAASYADRILKGEKPADLPVQNPTKFELVINLKTAKALGLTIPQSLLATADEVIE